MIGFCANCLQSEQDVQHSRWGHRVILLCSVCRLSIVRLISRLIDGMHAISEAELSQGQVTVLSNKHSKRYRGVSWHKQKEKWQAQVFYKGKGYYVGLFTDPELAARAYDSVAMQFGLPTNFND